MIAEITNKITENLRLLGENPTAFLAQSAQTAVDFVSEPEGPSFLILKIFFIILGFGFLAAVIYLVLNTTYIRYLVLQDFMEFFTYKPYGAKRMTKTWEKIFRRLDMPDVSEHKLAIIEADDLLDSILKRMGYMGNTLADRLSHLTSATLHNISELLQAHTVRNNIVHDPDYRLTSDEARKTLEIYQKALQDLQVLE